MKDRLLKWPLAVALVSSTSLVTIAGCNAARKFSAPSASGPEEAPKKEYQWKDLSQGKAFFPKDSISDK